MLKNVIGVYAKDNRFIKFNLCQKKKIPPHNFHSILLASKPAWASAFCLHFHVNYSVFFTDGLVSIRMNSSQSVILVPRHSGHASPLQSNKRWNERNHADKMEQADYGGRNRLCTKGRKIRDVTCHEMHPPRIWFHWNIRGSIMLRFFHSIMSSSCLSCSRFSEIKKERFAIDKLTSKFLLVGTIVNTIVYSRNNRTYFFRFFF